MSKKEYTFWIESGDEVSYLIGDDLKTLKIGVYFALLTGMSIHITTKISPKKIDKMIKKMVNKARLHVEVIK